MSIWNQQFTTASFEEMLSEVGAESRDAIGHVRAWIRGSLGWNASLKHFQSSWGWAEAYEGQSGDLRGVYLIPEPGRVRVAISFERSGFSAIEQGELPKGVLGEVREGMCVLNAVWAECALQSIGDAEGVCELLGVLCGGG